MLNRREFIKRTTLGMLLAGCYPTLLAADGPGKQVVLDKSFYAMRCSGVSPGAIIEAIDTGSNKVLCKVVANEAGRAILRFPCDTPFWTSIYVRVTLATPKSCIVAVMTEKNYGEPLLMGRRG